MTFNRPQDISLTEMAQWIDSKLVFEEAEKERLLEYLYHLVLQNAYKRKFFNDNETYDDFTLYCVSRLLFRLTDETLQHVKSVVNYINTVLKPWQAEYVRLFCTGTADLDITDFNAVDFGDYLVDSASEFDSHSYSFYSISLNNIVREHLKNIPRRKNSAEWTNIYISCMLTLHERLSAATVLCDANLMEFNPSLFSRIIRELNMRPPILFHIEEHYSVYISVLVNEIIHAISAELSCVTAAKVTPTSCLKNLIIAASNKEEEEYIKCQ